MESNNKKTDRPVADFIAWFSNESKVLYTI